jgi:hypothetical protein
VGSRGYRLAADLTYQPGEVIVEVGSERGEGSTGFLAGLGPPLWSLDVYHAPEWLAALPRAKRNRVIALEGRAEELLTTWEARSGAAPIRFAWLDGHDWPYDGQPIAEAADYERLYRSRGQVYSRAASALSHLRIAQAIAPHVPEGGVIAFDDTWQSWTGKGGTAVPWLLDNGWWTLHQDDGWVALTR